MGPKAYGLEIPVGRGSAIPLFCLDVLHIRHRKHFASADFRDRIDHISIDSRVHLLYLLRVHFFLPPVYSANKLSVNGYFKYDFIVGLAIQRHFGQ